MLKHNSVFCVPFCANGAQKVTRVFKKKPILQLLNDMKNYKNVFTDYYQGNQSKEDEIIEA